LWHVILCLSSHPSLPTTLDIGSLLLWIKFYTLSSGFLWNVSCVYCTIYEFYSNRAKYFLGVCLWAMHLTQP
jgi:hypothetical protein